METTEGSGEQEARSGKRVAGSGKREAGSILAPCSLLPAPHSPLPAPRSPCAKRTIGPQRARARVGCSRQWLTQLATQLRLGELRAGPYGRERWFNAAEIATMRAHRKAHPRTPRKEEAKS